MPHLAIQTLMMGYFSVSFRMHVGMCVMEIERAQKGMDKNPKVKHACENMNEDELEIMIKNVFTSHKVIQ